MSTGVENQSSPPTANSTRVIACQTPECLSKESVQNGVPIWIPGSSFTPADLEIPNQLSPTRGSLRVRGAHNSMSGRSGEGGNLSAPD